MTSGAHGGASHPEEPGAAPGVQKFAVAAVHDAHGHVVGAAFLVGPSQLLTCAHVVTAALGLGPDAAHGPAPAGPVRLSFPLAAPGRILTAAVVPTGWQPIRADESGDIAVLWLQQQPPEGVGPVRSGSPRPLWARQRRCRSFGFPHDRQGGRWYEGRVVGPVGGGWIQLVNAHSQGYQIEEGFSGAPVWDTRTGRVIGMVVSVDSWGHRQSEHRPAAFMIPAHLLPVPQRGPGLLPRGLARWPAVLARSPTHRGGPGSRPRRRWARVLTTMAKPLVVVLALSLSVVAEPRSDRCASPVEVHVVTSPDHLASYQTMAEAYESWTRTVNHGCRAANLYVYPAPPAQVARGLKEGWSETAEWAPRDVGPHPDIWLPGATVVREDIPALPSVSRTIIAQSPLVLGVPRDQFDPVRDEPHRRAKLTWPDLFYKASRPIGDRSRDGVAGTGWGVVRPEPADSVAGRMVTAELYYGPWARRSGPAGPRPDDPARNRQEFEHWLETAHDAGNYPLGDSAALLCHQRRLASTAGGATPAAVITTEQALIEFNRGLPLGPGCPGWPKPGQPGPGAGGGQPGPPASGGLVAFYPPDTPWLDHYLVRLDWPDGVQSRAAEAAAASFQRWLGDDNAGHTAIRAAGLRVPVLLGNFPFTPADGVLPDLPLEDPPMLSEPAPDHDTQQQALRSHAAAARPGRVLLALDSSGSMRGAAGHRTRFDVALDGIEDSLGRMGGYDEFGLWTFSTRVADADRQVRPLGRRDGGRDAQMLARLRRSTPAGNTPLYRTINAGIAALLARRATDAGTAEPVRALVVLTDGQDTASGRLAPDLSHGSEVRVFVIAIGEASCDDRFNTRSLAEVTAATGGQCLGVAAQRVDQTLAELFGKLWEKGATG